MWLPGSSSSSLLLLLQPAQVLGQRCQGGVQALQGTSMQAAGLAQHERIQSWHPDAIGEQSPLCLLLYPCVCHSTHAAVLPMPGTMNPCGSATQDVQV